MDVKVLGTGCPKCRKLYDIAEKAIAASGVDASLTKVESLDDILEYGVMMTPALVVDGDVKCSGKLPKERDIVQWLTTAAS